MTVFRLISLALTAALLAGAPAHAQEQQTRTRTGDEVEITSDNFRVNEGENQATFSGNVVVQQPDLTVWADTVVVHYGPGGASDLREFEATGNVRIKQPRQTATGDRGVYNPNTEMLHLTGNVEVTNETGTVTGPELVVDIAEGTSEFIGGGSSGRVTGIFTPSEGQGGE